jgi:hypothetical protein
MRRRVSGELSPSTPIAVFTRMYGTCTWEASVRQRKLRRVPYIWSGTALVSGDVAILLAQDLCPPFWRLFTCATAL